MRGRVLIQLALLCAAGEAIAQPSDAEVFESVFKRRAELERVPVVLVVDGTSYGPLVLEVRNATATHVPANVILAAFAQARMRDDDRNQLARTARGGALAIDDLRAANLDVVYDPQRLELRVALPAASTERASHTLGAGVPAEAAGAIQPSDVSGYLNIHGVGGTATPNQLRFASAINVHRWVLEGRGELGESPIGVHRGDVLLSRDVPEHAVRYLVGDFAVGAAGLQPGFPILGMGVTRNFTLQPYRVIQPVGVFTFTLERPANVTVLVNGAPVQTLALAAGHHDIRDLPLGAGVNDIELLVRDESGNERRLQFSAASPSELLAPGIVQFALSLGFPLQSDVGLRSYAWSRPVLSGRRRWGITDKLTVGGSFDGDLDRQVVGGALAVATKLGNLAVDVSGSRDGELELGRAESVRYDYHRSAGATATNTFTVVARHTSSRFRSLSILDVDGRYRGDVSIATSRAVTARVFAQLSARYQIGRQVSDAHDASITFSRSFGGLTTDVLFGVRDSGSEPRDARVFVTAHWRLPERRGMLYATSRTSKAAGRSNELRFMTAPRSGRGGLVASASVRENRQNVGSDITLGYSNDRFISSVTGATGLDRATRDSSTAASFEVGTALAFAGGRIGWSRPITGSFAIVDRNDTLSDQKIGVNPVAGGYSANVDRFGPAVVTGLEPYRVGSVRVEAPDLRLGTSLGPASHNLMPAYKSGTLVVVGEPGTVFLRGSIRHADGKPVALAVGELVPRDAPMTAWSCAAVDESLLQQRLDCIADRPRSRPSAPLVVFTNRAGRFSVVGVVPGRYAIKLATGAAIPVDIPVRHAGVFNVGSLVVE